MPRRASARSGARARTRSQQETASAAASRSWCSSARCSQKAALSGSSSTAFFRLAAIDEHLSEVGPGRGVVRGERGGAAEVIEGFVEPSHLAQGNAEIAVGGGKVRPQRQRLAELFRGVGVKPLALQSQPQVA